MWHKNRSLTRSSSIWCSALPWCSLAPVGLALESQAEETEVYLPVGVRRQPLQREQRSARPQLQRRRPALANFGAGQTEFYAVVVQPDGKIVSVGVFFGLSQDFVVIRYNTDGSLDPTFSGDGWLLTDFGGGETARAMALQSDGKIIAAGDISHNAFALARYNPDGSLDTAFDGDGKVLTDLAGQDEINAVVVQNDGKIVVAGRNFNDIAVARYNADGSLDTCFDTDGNVVPESPTSTVILRWRCHALQSDGKIVVAGYAETFRRYRGRALQL